MQKKIEIPNAEMTAKIFGSYDKNISRLEEAFSVRIANTGDNGEGDTILVDGAEVGVQKAADTCRDLGIGGVVVIGGDGSFRGIDRKI